MRWSENETLEFVRIYLRHECLWNPASVDYKTRCVREKAFSDIVTELKSATGIVLDEDEVKVKIKSLRSTYVQEIAKIRLRSSSGSVYKPTIKWFDVWHKCLDRVKRNYRKRDQEIETPEQEDPCSEMWILESTENAETEEADPFVSQTEKYQVMFKSEPKETCSLSPDPFKPKDKMKRIHLSTDLSEESHRTSVVSNSQLREDEFDIYGKYIASQLRNMDLQKAIRVQLEIQSIVSEARLSCLSGH
ncbi:uncharacterized protein LOC106134338 [Amyelois transitella]|uniref:uncharacterized protein LOC106134338 n=1 Tax=Amyelois transitella TaxID=680683 RepID=UPI00298F8E86|nr:uncharacterized protein LOC106134338 [Amyelois transitella]